MRIVFQPRVLAYHCNLQTTGNTGMAGRIDWPFSLSNYANRANQSKKLVLFYIRDAMSYTVEITEDNLIPVPDALCAELGFTVGDILVCAMDKDHSEIRMTKHSDQTLTDEQISAAGNLTRVVSLGTAE